MQTSSERDRPEDGSAQPRGDHEVTRGASKAETIGYSGLQPHSKQRLPADSSLQNGPERGVPTAGPPVLNKVDTMLSTFKSWPSPSLFSRPQLAASLPPSPGNLRAHSVDFGLQVSFHWQLKDPYQISMQQFSNTPLNPHCLGLSRWGLSSHIPSLLHLKKWTA